MKTVIFGGAFNPITKAHIDTATEISDRLEAEVWFMPCKDHTFGKKLESFEHRKNMIELVTDITVSNFEQENDFKGSTLDLMTKLQEIYEKREFYFLIGMDNANCMGRWKNWTNLIKKVKFLVIPRRGTIPTVRWFMDPPHIYMKDIFIDQMSSTEVRNAILNGETTCMLDDRVYDYIVMNGLYKGESK